MPLPSGVTCPTAPVNVVVPLPAFTVKLLVALTLLLPSTVLANTTGEFELATVKELPTLTGLEKVMVPAAVLVTLPCSVMLLLPVAV